MSAGKVLRMRRILDPATGTTVMFAFSHGTSAPEVLPGLEDPTRMVEAAARGGADCVFLGPGIVSAVASVLGETRSIGLAVKTTATASRGGIRHQEVATASVERALELGADAVVALLPFAPENEPDVIRLTAELGEACDRWGMPFIAEAEYPNAYYGDEDYASTWGVPYLRRSARLCAELGADIIKSNWTGSGETFQEIVDCVPVPVVVAGGSRESDLDLLTKIAEARAAGAVGCSVGRNIFQHDAPESMVRAICAVVRGVSTPESALEEEQASVVGKAEERRAAR
jgi:fructose-bisphosphate aldolase/2-amino-3,7-dideoxy-D-threo-hept-6-ulosonate synthase